MLRSDQGSEGGLEHRVYMKAFVEPTGLEHDRPEFVVHRYHSLVFLRDL